MLTQMTLKTLEDGIEAVVSFDPVAVLRMQAAWPLVTRLLETEVTEFHVRADCVFRESGDNGRKINTHPTSMIVDRVGIKFVSDKLVSQLVPMTQIQQLVVEEIQDVATGNWGNRGW